MGYIMPFFLVSLVSSRRRRSSSSENHHIAGTTGSTARTITRRWQTALCASGGMGQPTLTNPAQRLDRTGLLSYYVRC
jgi:hypothetical protein